MMMVTKAQLRRVVDGAREDLASRVTSVHEAVGRVRRTVERVGHEIEDRANERHQQLVAQHVALLERIGMVEATVERGMGKVLEHETRHLHERKEARRRLSRELEDAVDDAPAKVKGTIAHARSVVGDLPCCGGQYPGHVEGCEVLERSRAEKERRKAQLSASSRIDPADAVRGAPTVPPRTVTMTGLPGPAPRKIDGALAAMEGKPSSTKTYRCSFDGCAGNSETLTPHSDACNEAARLSAQTIADQDPPQETSGVTLPKLESATDAAARTGVSRGRLVAAMKGGKVDGAVARPGRAGGWSAPAAAIDAFLQS